MTLLLEINNLTLSIDNEELLEIDNFKMNKGDLVFILGDNGSGKSTFIKSIFSINKNDTYAKLNTDHSEIKLYSKNKVLDLTGNVRLNDRDIYERFVYIEQEGLFHPKFSVYETLEAPLVATLKSENKNQIIKELIEKYSFKFLDDIFANEKKYKEVDENNKVNEAIKILKKKKISECSGGQKKLVSLISSFIRAIALDVI